MRHYETVEWKSYIDGGKTEEEQCQMEEHLYQCDECFLAYTYALEAEKEALPSIQDSTQFIEQVSRQLTKTKAARQPSKKKSLKHYGIAVACTLLLMSSGVFQSLTGIADKVEQQNQVTDYQPLSNQMMNKTVSLIDKLEESQRGHNDE
ncbi:hypothetical protein LC040_18420 [Bacillus tianshenii]|nr:hypothetical protein LC040_18420 [Bacillus tianshenii]